VNGPGTIHNPQSNGNYERDVRQKIVFREFRIQIREIVFCLLVCLMVFSATLNNILAMSWRSVLLVEETGLSHFTDKLYHIMLYTSQKIHIKFMCIGRKTVERFGDTAFIQVFKPHAHTLYILRHCLNIVYAYVGCTTTCAINAYSFAPNTHELYMYFFKTLH
jgi:hypothetical protein